MSKTTTKLATAFTQAIANCDTVARVGRVVQFYGLVVEATGPDVFLGELCEIYSPAQGQPVLAEVVGFKEQHVLLIPYGELHGIHIGSEIIATGRRASLRVSDAYKGRIVDAFGNPIDDKGPIEVSAASQEYPLHPEPVNPLHRERIHQTLETGVKVIDSCLTVGKGQRLGIMAGSGVGKSTLLGMIARNTAADVNVIALIGERGREVLDFIEDALGPEGLARSVVVVATADQPALVRRHAAFVATTLAEYFCDQDQEVMLMMDSITRLAMAQRDIGLAVGEPPTARGYTPSTFSLLPQLLERTGNFRGRGSITAFYTVLVEGKADTDPVAENLRAILDGHIILDRAIANSGRYPAVDVLQSISRLLADLVSKEERQLLTRAINLLHRHWDSKDMIELGAYKTGQNPELDRAVEFATRFQQLMKQDSHEKASRQETVAALKTLMQSTAPLTQKPSNRREAIAQVGLK